VLGAAIRVAPEAVFALLRPVIDARPNENHRIVASLLAAGGEAVTLNFDTCIEKAAAPATPEVVHAHGALRDRAHLEDLGAYFHTIESGLPRAMAERLDDVLGRAQQVWIAGYSASDHFDIRPHLRRLAERGVDLTGCTVTWIAHGGHRPAPLATYGRWFQDAGARWEVLDGDTTEALRGLLDGLGLPRPAAPGAEPDAAPDPMPPADPRGLDERTRAAVTAELYRTMGFTAGRKALVGRLGPPAIEDEAAIAWSEGRYGDARRVWQRLADDDPATALRRRERIAGCFWAQGRLLPAAAVLARSRGAAEAALRSSDAGLVSAGLDWVDTAVRTLEHMDRTELRVLPKGRARARILAMVPEDASRLPFHTRSRHEEVRSWLTAGLGSAEAAAVGDDVREGMLEAASLNGHLNYRHRQLRDRVASGEVVPAADYRTLRRQATELGATGDAARVVLIPGSQRAFSPWAVVTALWSIQLGPWQRLRALARSMLGRLRRA
jgi:hypothetical protein